MQHSNCNAFQITADSSHLVDDSYAEIQVNKVDTSDATLGNKPSVWPMVTAVQNTLFISAPVRGKSLLLHGIPTHLEG